MIKHFANFGILGAFALVSSAALVACGDDSGSGVFSMEKSFEMVLDKAINADFQCNPLQGPDCLKIIQALQGGQTVEKQTFMEEPWFVSEDVLKDISYKNNSGKDVTEPLIVVDKATVDEAY